MHIEIGELKPKIQRVIDKQLFEELFFLKDKFESVGLLSFDITLVSEDDEYYRIEMNFSDMISLRKV